ncbi:MAG: type IV pilus assembly protein PilM [Candidatus Omnitrophica bacterium]|nr:type IV pilus assembly protein PilM [Candidatus Omnitrophota bacterium]MBU1933080.1 type IV pilus assembly protein PilM [Candidatus Omnitrophota bacterium]
MNVRGVFQKDYIVGLDIGSSSIKLAKFLKTPDGLCLIKTDIEEVSSYAVDEALRGKEIQSLLKKITRGVDVSNSKFIVTINCPKTAIKKAIVPYMPRTELRNAIRLAVKNYFPFPIDDSLVDFEISGEVIEKGVKKFEVLVATSPKKTVNEFLSILKEAGVKPVSFIAVPYAMQRLAHAFYPGEGQTRCFLDIGSCHTELVILKGKGLVFSRKIPVAGNDITKEMTGVLVSDKGRTELSLDEAEKIKRKIGLPPEGESKMINDKISTTQILSMIRMPLEQLVNEIERCFDYYREEAEGGKIDSFVLLGGGSSLRRLTDFLSKELGIEVKLLSSLEGIKIEPGAIDGRAPELHRLALAIGAGLGGVKGLNLLPLEIKEETKKTFKRAGIQAVVTGVIITLALVYIGMRIQVTSFQKRIAASRIEMLSLKPQMEQVKAQNLTSEILRNEPYWEDVFRELSNIVPDDSYLTQFTMKDKTFKMRGVVISSAPEEILSGFILALEKGIFKDVRLISTKEIRDTTGNEFELECRID